MLRLRLSLTQMTEVWKQNDKYKTIKNKERKMKKKRNYWNIGLSDWFKNTFINTTERIRARNVKGRYVGDDKSTPDINEAYVTVPRKKRTKKPKRSSASSKV
jgi:hypothetical protein